MVLPPARATPLRRVRNTQVHPPALGRRLRRPRHPRAVPCVADAAPPPENAAELPRNGLRRQPLRAAGTCRGGRDPLTGVASTTRLPDGSTRTSCPSSSTASIRALAIDPRTASSAASSGSDDRERAQAPGSCGRCGRAPAGPRVEPEMVVVAAGRDEQRTRVGSARPDRTRERRRRTPRHAGMSATWRWTWPIRVPARPSRRPGSPGATPASTPSRSSGERAHLQLAALGLPLLAWPVAVDLDSVSLRVVEIERLGDEMI